MTAYGLEQKWEIDKLERINTKTDNKSFKYKDTNKRKSCVCHTRFFLFLGNMHLLLLYQNATLGGEWVS